MNNENPVESMSVSSGDAPPRIPTYELLVRQSKKMGGVATKALHDVKNILHNDITLPHAGHFLTHLPRAAYSKMSKLEAAEQLKRAVRKSHQVLGAARTVFPIKLFPDSIIVDRTKISITRRDFFWSSNTISFQVDDILNVSCGVGPLFGSLTIASRVMSSVDHFQIDHLWRSDAILLKHLIQGHIIAKHNMLETDQLTRKEMVETLCELGIDSDR